MKKNILFYICECNFPSTSAYSIHVSKMCNEFAKNYEVILVSPNSRLSLKEIKKKYNLENNFRILSIFNSKKKLNLINRLIFSLKIYKIINKINFREKSKIVYSRSIIFSLLLSFLKKKNVLEIHHEPKGFTKFIFFLFKFFNFFKYINFVLLNKSLKKDVKVNDGLILDDAADFDQFNTQKKIQKKFNFTCLYIGSFYKGKGFEQIVELAKICPKIIFHAYGDKNYLEKNLIFKNFKNLKIFQHINYSKIPQLLQRYEIVLLPLQEKNFGRGNIDISKTTSPMKMFDYLASGRIILASKLKVYSHILINGFNCILIEPSNILEWKKTIHASFKNIQNIKYLKKNAKITARKYTWKLRVKKIEKKYLKNLH